MALTQQEKGEAFRALHQGEPFVIPNPWDAGSASVLAGLGFKSLATTSSGFAFTLGRPDGTVTLDEIAAHVSSLSEATDLPVSVDLENGYGPAPEDAARAIARVAEAGAQRVSVGGGLTWSAVNGGIEAAERIIDDGDFSGLGTPGRVQEWLGP